jgi:coenzyme F420-reducing hydrogenase beta subunit
MILNESGFLVPDLDGSFSDLAVKVCPFNPDPDEEAKDEDALAAIFLKESRNSDERIGKFENIYVGYSKANRKESSSGGIATFVFEQLLKQKLVDHLYIVKEIDGSYAYQWFNEIEQILDISKTRYIPVTLEKLFKEIDNKVGKVAISGVACFIKAIRLKQHYNAKYKDKIPFLVGIICGGLKSSFFTDYLAQKSGIKGNYSKAEYRIKNPISDALDYSFGAFDDENEFHQIKMKSVGDMWGSGLFKANACDFCDDVTTELADISLGDAWLSPYNQNGSGNSVIVTRSKVSEKIINEGISSGELDVTSLTLGVFKLSQSGSFKHRQIGIKYRLDLLKKKNKIYPFKRNKFFEKIPFEFRRVQNQRIKIRKLSLVLWEKFQNSQDFDINILSERNKLFKKTKFYHRIQRLKNIFNIRNI